MLVGDAQILDIDPTAILAYFAEGADAVVVAGFQGSRFRSAKESGAITTLGRGGTIPPLCPGRCLKAERVSRSTPTWTA